MFCIQDISLNLGLGKPFVVVVSSTVRSPNPVIINVIYEYHRSDLLHGFSITLQIKDIPQKRFRVSEKRSREDEIN